MGPSRRLRRSSSARRAPARQRGGDGFSHEFHDEKIAALTLSPQYAQHTDTLCSRTKSHLVISIITKTWVTVSVFNSVMYDGDQHVGRWHSTADVAETKIDNLGPKLTSLKATQADQRSANT
eukprot:5474682-Pleurochrysis_carterae.AAC.1